MFNSRLVCPKVERSEISESTPNSGDWYFLLSEFAQMTNVEKLEGQIKYGGREFFLKASRLYRILQI
jgi:hypothetical protein